MQRLAQLFEHRYGGQRCDGERHLPAFEAAETHPKEQFEAMITVVTMTWVHLLRVVEPVSQGLQMAAFLWCRINRTR